MAPSLGVIFLVEGIIFCSSLFHCSGATRNPRSGSPESDIGNTIGVVLPLEGIIFGTPFGWMGLKVERCCIYRTNNDEFWRHGATGLNVGHAMVDA
jgi:hypothetical protein